MLTNGTKKRRAWKEDTTHVKLLITKVKVFCIVARVTFKIFFSCHNNSMFPKRLSSVLHRKWDLNFTGHSRSSY